MLFLAMTAAFLPRSEQRLARVSACATVFVLLTCAYALLLESRWSRMIEEMRAELRMHAGYVTLPQTQIDRSQFFVEWPLPTLSVLLSGKCVSTMVVPSTPSWQPFNHRTERILTRFRKYDVSLGGPGC
jgi:hypothetical protein